MKAVGLEAHPFVLRVARAKLRWRSNPSNLLARSRDIISHADGSLRNDYPELIRRCYPSPILAALDGLRRAWEERSDDSDESELCWLALASILRECSPVGTAQWQYVLPEKSKAASSEPIKAFEAKVRQFARDMQYLQDNRHFARALVNIDDARLCSSVETGWADLVITSPPYVNNYDYADATRLEMSFFGDVQCWGDLQEKVRTFLVRSCTQHVARDERNTSAIVESDCLRPIRDELSDVVERLKQERSQHAGQKPYHTLVASYFADMAAVWIALRKATRRGALVCFVIGDSAPYGIYVPVDRWFGELAIAAGFTEFSFEKTRDRNIKWKNRKHRVPLHEGRLWVQG